MSTKPLMDRIRKLLALARSSNPHEAAEALRRAQELMAAHAIDEDDLALSGIGQFTSNAGYPRSINPARYVWVLADTISRIFGARYVWAPEIYRFKFYGRVERAEPAAYACAVLWRQLHRARLEYMRQQNRRLKRTTRVARADRYAEGWLYSALHKCQVLTLPAEELQLVSCWHDQNIAEKLQSATIRISAKMPDTNNALVAGIHDGKRARLHAPMTANASPHQIGFDRS